MAIGETVQARSTHDANAISAPARGGYARSEVDVGALRGAAQGLELSLALPFGALFSALLPARPSLSGLHRRDARMVD